MTIPMDRMRLLTVHPLDGPVVALAVVASGPDPEHGKLESVAPSNLYQALPPKMTTETTPMIPMTPA